MKFQVIALCAATCLAGCTTQDFQEGGRHFAERLAVLALDIATDEQCRAKAVSGSIETDGFCEMRNDLWLRDAKLAHDRRINRERRDALQASFSRYLQERPAVQ